MKGNMEQDLTARERIMKAFIAQLEKPYPSVKGAAMIPQLAKFIDGHFSRYCSFYDRRKLIKNLESGTQYYLSFLARPAEVEKISVSALTKAAGVNRTTFYKLFPNVSALYEACCDELTDRFLSVPVPGLKTPEEMRGYVRSLWEIMAENEAVLFALSHRVNKRALPYQIALKLKDRLASTLSAEEQASFKVRENLETMPELFSTWFTLMTIEKLAPEVYPDRNLPAYDPSRSLIENIAACFAARYGGSEDYYYALGGAALKLLAQKRFFDVRLSEFCDASGYPRSTFYAHFGSFTDYVLKVMENCALTGVSAFLYFLNHPQELDRRALEIFRGEMVKFEVEAIRAIFVNGSISYLLSGLFAYMMRILTAQKVREAGERGEGFTMLLAYYITYAMRMFSMNYMGDMSDAELLSKKLELERIKKTLREF